MLCQAPDCAAVSHIRMALGNALNKKSQDKPTRTGSPAQGMGMGIGNDLMQNQELKGKS